MCQNVSESVGMCQTSCLQSASRQVCPDARRCKTETSCFHRRWLAATRCSARRGSVVLSLRKKERVKKLHIDYHALEVVGCHTPQQEMFQHSSHVLHDRNETHLFAMIPRTSLDMELHWISFICIDTTAMILSDYSDNAALGWVKKHYLMAQRT